MVDFNRLGGVGVMGYISPMSTDDTYPVIDPLYGIDGFRNVETIDELIEIPFERRRSGMIVGIDGGERYFRLKNTEWNGDINDWKEVFITDVNPNTNKSSFIDKEIPNGETNNDNKIFELTNQPILKSEHIYLNGLLQDVENDYIMSGKFIIFNEPPMLNSKIRCSYRIN